MVLSPVLDPFRKLLNTSFKLSSKAKSQPWVVHVFDTATGSGFENKLIIASEYFGYLSSTDCHDFSTHMGALFIG